jgi:UDP-N-acetylmuramoyl-tripeptide--D-alanyl-D-alanine ligase
MTIEQLYNIYLNYPSVQTDTRKLKEDDIFFALKGDKYNGHQFLEKAFEAGAAYAVIDEAEYASFGRTILVDNVLQTLQQLAKHHRLQFPIPFLAITGSNGKTTTKELVHAVLSSSLKTYTTAGNLNNHIGIPLTMLKIKKDAEIAVIEMGANHVGEIASYCLYALPTHGMITNCGKAHLEGFGGIEGVRKGKGELYDHLRSTGGTAFIMKDYPYLADMSRGIPEIITYGTADADYTGTADNSHEFLEVNITKGAAIQHLKTKLVGDYNLPNVLAAIAVGKYFKIDDDKIKEAIENYIPSNSRSQLVEQGTNKIILDAYNANPSSMKLAIENIAGMPGNDKMVLLGAMAELGEDSLAEHESVINLLNRYNWKQVVLVGGDFLKIKHPYLQFDTSEKAKQWFQQQHLENTTILIKGSRSFQMEKILED